MREGFWFDNVHLERYVQMAQTDFNRRTREERQNAARKSAAPIQAPLAPVRKTIKQESAERYHLGNANNLPSSGEQPAQGYTQGSLDSMIGAAQQAMIDNARMQAHNDMHWRGRGNVPSLYKMLHRMGISTTDFWKKNGGVGIKDAVKNVNSGYAPNARRGDIAQGLGTNGQIGKAEAAFGKTAQADATKAAQAAFGPTPAQTPGAQPKSAQPNANTAQPAQTAQTSQTVASAANPVGSTADALKSTYDGLMQRAGEVANKYMRQGTNGAPEAPSVTEAARQIVAENSSSAPGGSDAPGANDVAAVDGGYQMVAEPPYARGGELGSSAQTAVDIDGATAYLGNIDGNDGDAVNGAANEIRDDIAWMKDNDYMEA